MPATPTPQQVPQLTDLGEQLAQDSDRKHLESLLERLFEPLSEPLSEKQGAGSRQEAIKSARHILETVWSMQHMNKLSKNPETTPRNPPRNPPPQPNSIKVTP